MANKTRKIDFNKERLYEALRMNGINSVRELCGANETLCYGKEFVSRKTIERACQTGEISNRTLDILSKALDCTPEFFTAPDVIIKEDMDQCIVYMSDNRETLVKGTNLYWVCDKDINDRCVYRFYADCPDGDGEYMVAEFCAAVCYGIVRMEV
jgi:hypothetical protein